MDRPEQVLDHQIQTQAFWKSRIAEEFGDHLMKKATAAEDYGVKLGGGQAGYKKSVVARLQELGVEVVGSFDDNAGVCTAIRSLGVKIVVQVQYLVEVSNEEFRAGRLKGRPRTNGKGQMLPQQDRYNSPSLFPRPLQQQLFESRRMSQKEIRASLFEDFGDFGDFGDFEGFADFNPMAVSGD